MSHSKHNVNKNGKLYIKKKNSRCKYFKLLFISVYILFVGDVQTE